MAFRLPPFFVWPANSFTVSTCLLSRSHVTIIASLCWVVVKGASGLPVRADGLYHGCGLEVCLSVSACVPGLVSSAPSTRASACPVLSVVLDSISMALPVCVTVVRSFMDPCLGGRFKIARVWCVAGCADVVPSNASAKSFCSFFLMISVPLNMIM